MATLTATARGQVTFRKAVLKHLGVEPGGKIHLDLLPDGRAQIVAEKPNRSFREWRGLLKGKTNGARLTLEQIGEAIAESGAVASGHGGK